MCILQRKSGLFFQTSRCVHSNRQVLAVVLPLRKVFDIIKVSNSPGEQLMISISVSEDIMTFAKLTYVLITGVLSKDTALYPLLPFPMTTDFSGILLNATWSSGISISKSNLALRFGSSKQGKACLASQASK